MRVAYSNLLSITTTVLRCLRPIPHGSIHPTEQSRINEHRPNNQRYVLNRGVVRVLDARDEFITCAQVQDIGADGVLLFAITDRLVDGLPVRLQFALPTFPATLSGVVLCSSGDYSAVAFTGLSEAARELLDGCFEFEAYFAAHGKAVFSASGRSVEHDQKPCRGACTTPGSPCPYLP